MSMLSLPNETLLAIQGHLPPFSFFTLNGPPQEPLVQLDPSLRSLCATNKRFRSVYYSSLYETVVINLEREELESRCALLTNSVLKDDKVLALIKHILIRDTHRSADFSWKNSFDRYVRVLPNSMYRLSTESYTLLDHLLCSILACTPNLLTLDIQNTDVSLQESVVNAINNHPTLDRVTLENFRQLNDLPIDFCARTSFGRIHVQGLKLDRGLPPFPGGVLNALCQRSPESSLPGPHVYALQVEYFTSSAWIDLTFGSISELTVRDVDDTFASGCGGFFDRHPSLKAIHLDGYGLKHELALGSIPCLRELYRKSVKMGNGMERGFYVFSVKLSKRGHSQSSHSFNNLAATVRGHEATESTDISGDPGWILKSISFTILQDTGRVLPFILENLPPCEDLYIEREREVADESTNVTQSVLWDTILSSTRNLSHLISFGYSTFPLCDTAPSLPVRFGPSYDDYGEEDGGEYEDYFCSDELEDAREALSVFVERMARKCPRLEAVAIAGPEGYEISGYYLKFQVERTKKRGNGEGEGESEEVTVSRDLRMYK